MSRTIHLPEHVRVELRARREPRPPVRRSGTRSAVIAAELRLNDEEA